MPQPFPLDREQSWSINPEFVAQRVPSCIGAIGLVVLHWNRVEEELGLMISSAMGSSGMMADGGRFVNPNWVILTMMTEIDGNNKRIKLIDSILQQSLKKPLLGDWKMIKTQITSSVSARNKIVHSVWGWSEQYPESVVRVDKTRSAELWTAVDFQDVIERMASVVAEISDFKLRVIDENGGAQRM